MSSRLRALVLSAFGLLAACLTLHATVPRDFAVDFQATVSDTSPCITLAWTQRVQANITGQIIYRRLKGATTWVQQATLTTSQTSYADASALPGVEYEYWMKRSMNTAPYVAMGYIAAGVKIPAKESRGKLLLVVDDTMTGPLAPEIAQLEDDLASDGWTVVPVIAPRTGTAASTKALITAAYNADPTNVRMAYILGHVPVPYSGHIAPDGHGGHFGAWPADGYYGDMDGTWTDTTVNNTLSSSSRNWNIPGDGKFDQSDFPSTLELGVGRVDLQGLGRSPCAVDGTIETTLLRRYLYKAHQYRHKLGAYAAIPRRSLIRDGFGVFTTIEPFAITGWAGAFTCVGQGSPVDEAPRSQWFYPAYAGGQSYLWGHGNGGGSNEYAGNLGNSADFGHMPSLVAFPSVFGSWHGDWGSDNNLMRSVIAGNATGDSLGLCCFWTGRPNWFVHSLGMGETLGYMTRMSMNAGLSGTNGYQPGGSYLAEIHPGLMGDPALRIHAVAPPRGVAATSGAGLVNLSWTASSEPGLQGYDVYRAATSAGPFAKLTPTSLTGTAFTDLTATAGQSYAYLVRTVKMESVPGGSYLNLSLGSPVNITVSAGAAAPNSPSDLVVVSQTSAVNAQLTWADNSTDETGFRVERKVNVAGTIGAWSSLTTLPAGTTSFTDPGPFTAGNVYYYRVFATGGARDSSPSNMDYFEASAGFVEIIARPDTGKTTAQARILTVDKTAGTIAVTVTRFGGGTGAVTVNYATSNSTATAGTHYTATNGTLNWADGDTGNKTFTVPITNTATPQLARQFYVTLSSPGNGARLGVFKSIAVLITDPTATLAAPWAQTLLGNVTYNAPAASAEGVIGSTMVGGYYDTAGDNAAFIYQPRTGDGTMTAYIYTNGPSASWTARMGIVVRASTASTKTKMAGVFAGGYGTELAERNDGTLGNLTVTPGVSSISTPCWVRLTRLGDNFVAEQSPDGNSWTKVGQMTVSAMPGTAYWGIYNFAPNSNIGTDYAADFNLCRYSNISFGSVPAPASPNGVLIGSSTTDSLVLQWNTNTYSAAYRIERRSEGGDFTQIADVTAQNNLPTQSFTDTNLAPDTAYQYRITAYNSTGAAPASASVVGVTAPADITFTRTTNDPGGADATVFAATPDGVSGTQGTLTVSGAYPGATDIAKTYLRFDLTGLPGTIKTATLNLSFLAHRFFAETGWIYMQPCLLSTDTADVWNESSLTWNNAPLNDTAGTGVLSPAPYVGDYYIDSNLPVAGAQVSIPLYTDTLNANIGANNLVTIVAVAPYDGAQVDWASRENTSYAPPTLTMTITNPSSTRPGFLTVTHGAGSNMDLTWADGANNETGYQIERRTANGTWSLLQTLPANTTSFTDTSTLAGVIYEYRIRTTCATGSSSWAVTSNILHSSAAIIAGPISSPDGVAFTQSDAPAGSGYVPVGCIYYPQPLNFVTGQTLANIRNDIGGWVGGKITVGAAPLTIHDLGRWVASGNSGTHVVKLVDAATSIDVPGGSTSVVTAGAPSGQFKYAPLAMPVTLAANTSYYILSQETSGGDQWYNHTTKLTYTGMATVNNAVYCYGAPPYNNMPNINCSFGPVAFRYSDGSHSFTSGHSMTTLRNDVTGWLGMKITVGPSDMLVGQLGRWVAPGNTGSHSVKLVNATTGTNLATATVATAGAPAGQFQYTPLATAVTLSANTSYYLLSQETAGGDQWYDFTQAASGSATAYQSWLLRNGLPMDASGNGAATATPANDNLPNLVKYALGLTPATSGHGGRLGSGRTTVTGSDYLTFTYVRPEPAPAGVNYAIEASADLASANWSGSGPVEISNTLNNGLRTITLRDSAPMSGSNKRFMRLKITQP